MAMYRTVSMSFWTDSKVIDDFTPEDKYFYLYLFTNPHTNLCGCYEISMKQVVSEIGYSRDTVENLIIRFDKVHNVIRYCSETKEILLLNWHKYNWTTSEKFRKPLLKELQNIKNKSFSEYLMKIYNGYGIDTNYIDTTVTDTVTDTVSVTKKSTPKKRRFVPPTVDEVKAYCAERKNNVDAERFIDYYSSQNWKKANGRPLEDWKAAVRTWEKNIYDKPKQPTVTVPVPDYMQKQIEDFEKNYGW